MVNTDIRGVILGMDENDKSFLLDFQKVPHILIAGATGSGKSVCMNTIIFELMKKDNCRFILIDPKRVEFYSFRNSQKLYNYKIVEDVSESVSILKEVKEEMLRRFELLKKYDVKSIYELNGALYHIFICIDELTFLINQNKKEVTSLLSDIAMLGRAAGVHLILATQRPDRQTINGQILANINAVIGLKVRNKIESRLIIGSNELTELNGVGSAIYSNGLDYRKIKINYTSGEEIERLIDDELKEEVQAIIPPLPIKTKNNYIINIEEVRS